MPHSTQFSIARHREPQNSNDDGRLTVYARDRRCTHTTFRLAALHSRGDTTLHTRMTHFKTSIHYIILHTLLSTTNALTLQYAPVRKIQTHTHTTTRKQNTRVRLCAGIMHGHASNTRRLINVQILYKTHMRTPKTHTHKRTHDHSRMRHDATTRARLLS